MEIEVREASRRLHVNESRVRQLLRAGSLRGRRVGNSWLVLVEDVSRLESNRPRGGRPLAPRRAWAALDLLGGGRAPWLSNSARSQVRSLLAHLEAPDPSVWLSLLRNRSGVARAFAHPAALARLDDLAGRSDRGDVRRAGVAEAARRGFDLIALGGGVSQFYVDESAWPDISRALAIRESAESNVIIRIPDGVWPFREGESVVDAALAADLLESSEPRAVSAGAARLGQLLDNWRQDRARRAAHRARLGERSQAAAQEQGQ